MILHYNYLIKELGAIIAKDQAIASTLLKNNRWLPKKEAPSDGKEVLT